MKEVAATEPVILCSGGIASAVHVEKGNAMDALVGAQWPVPAEKHAGAVGFTQGAHRGCQKRAAPARQASSSGADYSPHAERGIVSGQAGRDEVWSDASEPSPKKDPEQGTPAEP